MEAAHPAARTIRVAVMAVLLTVLALTETEPAFATQPKPLTNWSFYVRDTNPARWYDLGCDQGVFDRNNGWKNSFVMLDFGGQTSTGTKLTIILTPVTYDNIKYWSEEFAHGYRRSDNVSCRYPGSSA